VLPGMPEAVRPAEVVGVHDAPVDGLGVVPSRVESREVRVRRRNRTNVLGAVEPPCSVLFEAGSRTPSGKWTARTMSRVSSLRCSNPNRGRERSDPRSGRGSESFGRPFRLSANRLRKHILLPFGPKRWPWSPVAGASAELQTPISSLRALFWARELTTCNQGMRREFVPCSPSNRRP
jgi:hypothetical protein